MTSINSLNNGAYYQLSGQAAGMAGSSSASNTLLQAMSGTGASASSASNAYLLDLSPAAQQYLNGAGSASSPSLAGASDNFTLTTQQQQAITDILTKYKDAPQTQTTFNQIQNDLNQAGLGANQLALQDQAKNFNTTEILINDLNGNYDAADALAASNSSAQQTKSNNYMQQIIKQWQGMASSGASAAGVTAASSSGEA